MLTCPDHISVTGLLKALPVEEGAERYLYMEASNEAKDYDNEVVMAKALAESADYYLRFGNVDIDHITLRGARENIPNYSLYEVGIPEAVKVDHPRTMVKARIYRGEGHAAEQANMLWASLTKLNPPARWYPSVGGAVLNKTPHVSPDGDTGMIVTKVRWTNIGLSKTPVNLSLQTATTIPMSSFAKAWGANGLDMAKALTAAATSDVAELSGGGALGEQSLDKKIHSYWDFREEISRAMRSRIKNPTVERVFRYAIDVLGLAADQAAKWAERFFRELTRSLRRK
jgi:hypothetical protein